METNEMEMLYYNLIESFRNVEEWHLNRIHEARSNSISASKSDDKTKKNLEYKLDSVLAEYEKFKQIKETYETYIKLIKENPNCYNGDKSCIEKLEIESHKKSKLGKVLGSEFEKNKKSIAVVEEKLLTLLSENRKRRVLDAVIVKKTLNCDKLSDIIKAIKSQNDMGKVIDEKYNINEPMNKYVKDEIRARVKANKIKKEQYDDPLYMKNLIDTLKGEFTKIEIKKESPIIENIDEILNSNLNFSEKDRTALNKAKDIYLKIAKSKYNLKIIDYEMNRMGITPSADYNILKNRKSSYLKFCKLLNKTRKKEMLKIQKLSIRSNKLTKGIPVELLSEYIELNKKIQKFKASNNDLSLEENILQKQYENRIAEIKTMIDSKYITTQIANRKTEFSEKLKLKITEKQVENLKEKPAEKAVKTNQASKSEGENHEQAFGEDER